MRTVRPARPLRKFRVEENAGDVDGSAPFALHDDTDQIVRVGSSPRLLSDIAFENLGADEVAHDGKYLVKRDGSR